MSGSSDLTQQDSESSDDIEKWKRIVTELSLRAPNQQIKSCIQTYDPENPTKTNIKTISKSFKKDIIIDTLDFLSKQKTEDANKENLVQKLCVKIQNYFPDVCQICNASYTFGFDDISFLQCVSCGQEAHRQCYFNLLEDMNLVSENETIRVSLFQIPGFFFLCHSCQDGTVNFTQRNLPKSSNKLIAHVPKDPPNGDEETNITIQPALPLKDSTNDKTKSSLSIQEDSSILTKQTPKRSLPSLPNVIIANQNSFPISSTKYAGRTEYMRKKLQREKDNNSVLISEDSRGAIDLSRVAEPQIENTNPQNEASNNIVCRFYKKGRCKHGLHGRNCIYYHPKACSKLLKFGNKVPKGCNQGVNCPNFHPRMCSSSIRNGECFNETCSFTHVKGTRRKPTKDIHNERQEPLDFLKILDNFRTEMVTLINNNNNPQPRNQQPDIFPQSFPARYPNQMMSQQPLLQRIPNQHQHQNVPYPQPRQDVTRPPPFPRNLHHQ